MELRNYLGILRKYWWLITPFTLIALTLAIVFSYSQPPVYEAKSSYVAKLDTSSIPSGDTLYGLDTLTQRTSILSTYCEVIGSQTIRREAYRLISVEIPPADLDKLYIVNCTVVPATNVLILSVQGPSSALTTRLNQAIGLAGVAQSNTLYSYFGLQLLDTATVKQENSNRLQIGLLGGILGLIVGIGLSFGMEYLLHPTEQLDMQAIRDPKLGVYNAGYFEHRLNQEIKRAIIRLRPISVAAMRVKPTEEFSLIPEPVQATLMRNMALFLNDHMRDLDTVAAVARNTFAIMMPETTLNEAHEIVTNLHNLLRSQPFTSGGYTATFMINSGIVESSGGNLDLKTTLSTANEALRAAEQDGDNTIQIRRTTPLPFNLDDELDTDNQGFQNGASAPNLFMDWIDQLDQEASSE